MAEASNQGRRRMAARSGVWAHFERFTDDQGSAKARCRWCSTVLKADTRGGTSTLRNHVNKYCKGRDQSHPTNEPPPPPHAPPSSSRPEEPLSRGPARLEESSLPLIERMELEEGGRGKGLEGGDEAVADLARMIALHGYDPSIVEDDYFSSFVRRLNPEFKLPSRRDIEDLCDGIFDQERKDQFSRLTPRAREDGHSVAVVKAQIVDAGEVVYVACHFIDDHWNLHRLLMDAYAVVPFERWLYPGPLLGVPAVVSRSNSSQYLLDSLEWIVARVTDAIGVNGAMPFMKVCRITDDPDLNRLIEESEEIKDVPTICYTTFVDNVLHSVARCLLDDDHELYELLDQKELEDLTRHEREKLLLHHDLEHLLAYQEEWYLYYCSLKLLGNEAFVTATDLETSEIQTLSSIWCAVYRAIQTLSASRGPTSNLCLVELFNVREALQSQLARSTGDRDLSYLLTEAKGKLDEAIKDSYLDWSIPLVLDPRYKLRFIEFLFNRAFGSEDAVKYIEQVRRNIHKMYHYYAGDYGGAIPTNVVSSHPLYQAWYDDIQAQDNSELDRYLNDNVVPPTQDFDILDWWKRHEVEYPNVAKMARDALAMPTCSKLSTEQMAHIRSIIRGYSKGPIWLGSKFQIGLRSS